MRLLIDGYNLLHVTHLFGQGALAGTLQGSREALLGFLASALTASQRRTTTIVFDAAGAPPNLPAMVHFDHIEVRYARGYPDADTLLEEIIEQHRSPRGLLVVSSDHRVQRAARRRGAKTTDSGLWHAETQQAIRSRNPKGFVRRDSPVDSNSVAYWAKQFSGADVDELARQLRSPLPSPAPQPPSKAPPPVPGTSHADLGMENPFPPGYGEDLLEDEGT